MKLPQYVENKPDHIKKKWLSIFNESKKLSDERIALLVANKWLQKQKTFLKRSTVVFEIDKSEGFIKRSDDGDEYVTLKLGSLLPHKDRKKYTEDLLHKWADYVNKGNVIIGDVDHTEYDKLLSTSMSNDMIRQLLKMKTGIAKGIKAIVQDGTLFIRALIDKRYRNIIEKSKGVSAEAFVSHGEDGSIEDGELLGFTFNVNTEPADNGAGVLV